ncbi:hypothetical protein CHELA1G11_11999 [Hyphomicrobiales bacterium]|nr:hypothetical protein CHELA1G11_11999 [Hyphomicrobiales bacterium]CAH1663995.1 hypothetical protein CHELA1G2_12312 [Hyphomicrobiales bacterium]
MRAAAFFLDLANFAGHASINSRAASSTLVTVCRLVSDTHISTGSNQRRGMTENSTKRFRCGDIVRHLPSGEEWLLAYADYDTGYLSAAGWPDSEAKISDCDLVRAVDDDEHRKRVADWAPYNDRRGRAVARLYGAATGIEV